MISGEVEKRMKYVAACQERRAQFTPICFSVDGMWGSEASLFIKRMADQLARKWEKPYSLTMGWLELEYLSPFCVPCLAD